MALKIDKNIIEKATKCGKEISCISSECENLCKVERCVGGKVHFIKCLSSDTCSYRVTFGNALMCTCPVRKDIYNNYKK